MADNSTSDRIQVFARVRPLNTVEESDYDEGFSIIGSSTTPGSRSISPVAPDFESEGRESDSSSSVSTEGVGALTSTTVKLQLSKLPNAVAKDKSYKLDG
jgi:hypothetical protein